MKNFRQRQPFPQLLALKATMEHHQDLLFTADFFLFFHTQHYFVNQRKIHTVNSLQEHFIAKKQCRLLSTDGLIAQLHTCTPNSNYWSASLLSLLQLVTSSSVPVHSSNYWPALLLSPPQCVHNSQPQNSDPEHTFLLSLL